MAKYYILGYASGTKETGPQYPQVQSMSKGYNYNSPDSIYQLTIDVPKFFPNLDHFILHKKARPTDLISNGLTSFGFIVSSRFMKILSSFNLLDHKFFQAKVLHDKAWLNDYYWLQIASDLTDFVDYQKSEFYIKNIAKVFSKDLGSIEVLSKEDYDSKRKDLKEKDSNLTISAKRIIMNSNFDKTLDMFSLPRFNSETFISERLKHALEEAKLTGLGVEETELIMLPYSFDLFN